MRRIWQYSFRGETTMWQNVPGSKLGSPACHEPGFQ
jgi:hypothetical protein